MGTCVVLQEAAVVVSIGFLAQIQMFPLRLLPEAVVIDHAAGLQRHIQLRRNVEFRSPFARTQADQTGQNMSSNLTALGDLGDDGVILNVVGVVGLDIGSETVKGALDGLL